jgi:hypothetical protein
MSLDTPATCIESKGTPSAPSAATASGVAPSSRCTSTLVVPSSKNVRLHLFMRLLLLGLVPSWRRELFFFRHLYYQRILFKFIRYNTLIHSVISGCLQRSSIHIDAIHEDFRSPLLDLTIGKTVQMFGIPLTEWFSCREAQLRPVPASVPSYPSRRHVSRSSFTWLLAM